MSTQHTPLRRFTAGVGALALSLVGLGAMTTAAHAAPGPDQPDSPKAGSLHIHKYVADQSDTPGNGTEQEIDGTPLEGVEFTIWRLGVDKSGTCKPIDLTDANAWNSSVPTGKAPADIEAVKQAGYCVVSTDKGKTAADGSLNFDALALGLFYVAETDVSGAKDVNGPVTVVSHAAPFYVTVPLPNAGDWLYNVHAYPKNQIANSPSKTISDTTKQKGLRVGDTVEYTITQAVPKLNASQGDTYKTASIWDNLGTSLAYNATGQLTLNGTELVEGTDYEIVQNGALVTWKLTGALSRLKAGDKLAVVFTAKVTQVTPTGDIANPGSKDPTKPGYGSEFNGNTSPDGPTPYTYWGNLTVKKVDEKSKPLVGAEFQIYPSANNSTCETDIAKAGDRVATGRSVASGVVEWDHTDPASSPLGLFVANSSDGELANPSKVYCLYETKVPAGYNGVGVQTVTLKPGTTATAGVNDLAIKNVQKVTPDLPLTGAQGTWAMVAGGLALVAVGGSALTLTRRRR